MPREAEHEWDRRSLQAMTTWVVVVAWVVFYVIAFATADQRPGPVAAVVQLVVPLLLWALAARLVVAGAFDLGRRPERVRAR
jgi:hypothetical protein